MTAACLQEIRLIGRSETIREVEVEMECAARSDANVLVTGETGVGKEIVARLIHRRSSRWSAPLVALNCAGLPDSLLESELFGHVRGSFSGAYSDKAGLLEMAANGTLFLDEVGELSVRMQVVLRRFLESGEIQRVGAETSHTCVNVRLITGTSHDLEAQVSSGAFREDLYFRLNVMHVAVPPLRERSTDIPMLVTHFLQAFQVQHKTRALEVAPDVMDALAAYRWPGNVRQLKSVIERTVLNAAGPVVTLADLPNDVIRHILPTSRLDQPLLAHTR